MPRKNFSRFNQPENCRVCGKLTTYDGGSGLNLCKECQTDAEIENAHADGLHGPNGREWYKDEKLYCTECGGTTHLARRLAKEQNKKAMKLRAVKMLNPQSKTEDAMQLATAKSNSKPKEKTMKPSIKNVSKPTKTAKPKVKREKFAPTMTVGEFYKKYETKHIHLNTDRNPKSGKSAKRFDLYKSGMTCKAAVEKGVKAADLRWDASPHHVWTDAKGEVKRGAYIVIK